MKDTRERRVRCNILGVFIIQHHYHTLDDGTKLYAQCVQRGFRTQALAQEALDNGER